MLLWRSRVCLQGMVITQGVVGLTTCYIIIWAISLMCLIEHSPINITYNTGWWIHDLLTLCNCLHVSAIIVMVIKTTHNILRGFCLCYLIKIAKIYVASPLISVFLQQNDQNIWLLLLYMCCIITVVQTRSWHIYNPMESTGALYMTDEILVYLWYMHHVLVLVTRYSNGL